MNFRRWITALAVLALFAGLASAQVAVSSAGTGSFQCQASVAVPPTLRAEGLTELIGDIVINCSGGVAPAIGSVLPTANVTVSLGANVTSRILSYAQLTTSSTVATNTSEALLLIDEPGSGLPMGQYGVTCPGPGCPVSGFGPNATQFLCGAATAGTTAQPFSAIGAGAGGCVEYAGQTSNGDYVSSFTSTGASGAPTPAPNMFAGVSSGNQVTFYGIPIMPPASAGSARIFRITNVRLNANALAGGGLAGTQSVMASIAISSNTSVLVNSPTPIVGFIQPGLSTTSGLRNTSNTGGFTLPALPQCSNQSVGTGPNAGILRFTENFGTAFKTRVSPTTGASGQAATLQNIPGTIYNSESGFVTNLPSVSQYGFTAGLADYGTRLKAVFNNVPSTVSIYVTTNNVVNLFSTAGAQSAPAPGVYTSVASYASLMLTETAAEGSVVTPTSYVQNASLTNVIGYAPISISPTGQGVATWEVMNTNPSTAENFDFGFYVVYTAAPGSNLPPPTTTAATVTLSYAPTATQGAFAASAGVQASGQLTLPRFSDAASAASSIFTIVQCTTNLLFPFITNQVGFDTGIAIVNTTLDPWGTTAQQGTCTMYFYGNNQPGNFTTPVIVPGQGINTAPANNWAFMASTIAPNFEGYMIAICNFQLAHGYAFVSDLGSQKLAHGYLALVLGNGSSKRAVGQAITSAEALEN
jgi:hypothetical protein